MQEFNGIAYGSPSGLEVLKNNVIVEVVNEFGEKTMECEEGNIVVTELKNHVFPLVRYKTEDMGFFDSEGLLHITKSRSNDSFTYKGTEFDGSLFWTVIFDLQQQLNIKFLQFQIRYTNNRFHFCLVMDNESVFTEKNLSDYIYNFIFEKFDIDIGVDVNIVNHISVEQGKNKIKYFINENDL